jgi:hypothetical protein
MRGRQLLRAAIGAPEVDTVHDIARVQLSSDTLIGHLRSGQLSVIGKHNNTSPAAGEEHAAATLDDQEALYFTAFKRGGFNTAWQLRYFECRGCEVRYFSSAADAKQGHDLKGQIVMSAVKVVKDQAGRVDILDTAGRTFYIRLNTGEESNAEALVQTLVVVGDG